MFKSNKVRLMILAAAVCAAAVTAPAVAAAGTAAGAHPFRIISVTPVHVSLIPDGPRKAYTIRWSGPADFPISAYYVPAFGCSRSGLTCINNSRRFAKGTTTLVWPGAAYCVGSFAEPFSGHVFVYLVNARGQYTDALPVTFTCEKGRFLGGGRGNAGARRCAAGS
jgi:hypothetical protein